MASFCARMRTNRFGRPCEKLRSRQKGAMQMQRTCVKASKTCNRQGKSLLVPAALIFLGGQPITSIARNW